MNQFLTCLSPYNQSSCSHRLSTTLASCYLRVVRAGRLLCSLVENLLSTLLEFTSSFVVHLLLFGHGCSSVCLYLLLLLLAAGWEVCASRGVTNLLRARGVRLLGHSALSGVGAVGLSDLLAGLLADDVEDTVFESLLVFRQPVLLPGVVEDPAVKVVPLQARFEEADASPIVRLLLEFEGTAVLHELSEFRRVATTELLQRSLNLLLLDRIVLLVLAATWQTLPRERSLN